MMHQQPQEMQGGAQQLHYQQYGVTQPPHDGTHLNNAHLPLDAGTVAVQKTISHSFLMGSTVQLLSNPPRYGVIQWIGTLPGITEDRVAGVELVSLCLLYMYVHVKTLFWS